MAGLLGVGLGNQFGRKRGRGRAVADRTKGGAGAGGSKQESPQRDRKLAGFHRLSKIMQSDEAGEAVFNAIAREAAEMTGFPIATIELCEYQRAAMLFWIFQFARRKAPIHRPCRRYRGKRPDR